MGKPTVSIVLPTYNSADTLPRAIDSVIAQTLTEWELIVIDDGSTDDTQAVLDEYRERLSQRIITLRQENAGPSAARNAGIEQAGSEYVCFLDADDEFLPHKIERQAEMFSRRSDLGFVFSDYAYIDLEGNKHNSVFDDLIPFVRDIPTEPIAQKASDARNPVRALGASSGTEHHNMLVCGKELFDRMIGRYIVSTITGMVRRDVLDDGPRFPSGFLYCEEWLFFLEVASRAHGGYVDDALSLHHHTSGSLSRTSATRNTLHRVRALEHVRSRYPQASKQAKAELSRQLHQSYRQLGMEHFRKDNFHKARACFQKALRHHFSPRSISHVVESFLRGCVQQS